MASHFVSCIYGGLFGSPINGRLNRERIYKESLESISRCGVDITCYTSPHELPMLEKYFHQDRNITNVKFKTFDLYSTYFHNKANNIRESNPQYYRESHEWMFRCVEIMWSKFLFLKEIISELPDLNYVYWIDAGISHPGIIHSRFNPYYEHNINFVIDLDKKRNHLVTQNDLIFNKDFIHHLNRYTGDRNILNIASVTKQHSRIHDDTNDLKGSVIGGLFGGNPVLVNKYCDSVIELFEYYLSMGELYKEEQIMTKILNDNVFPTKLFLFDTWYHPDWNKAYYNPDINQISFCDFFDEIKNEK